MIDESDDDKEIVSMDKMVNRELDETWHRNGYGRFFFNW
jgi:hypothetical protein